MRMILGDENAQESGKAMRPATGLFAVGVVFLLGGACAARPLDTGDATDRTESEAEAEPEEASEAGRPMSTDERRELRRKLAERGPKKGEVLERAPEDGTDTVRGEVPEAILATIIADLAATTEADPKAIEVAHAEAVTWSDGSLGCAEPGQVYTQVLVPGYRVILRHAGQQFDYRATEQGFFLLCSRPTLAAPGAADDPPVD